MQATEETGFRVPAHSPERSVRDLAQAMRRVAEDPDLRRRMGEAGRRRVAEMFIWERRVVDIVRLYARVLGE
jgi:glycosyltransferase involved in cell wall biosynthesis